jgi:SAM-dependent methyltransferase
VSERLSAEQVRKYWSDQAAAHGQSSAASWTDTPAIELEVRNIAARLHDGDRVLDVGCANGFSTVQYARARRVVVRGVDYVPQMIAEAKERAAALPPAIASRLEFAAGDILSLDEPDECYDKVVVVRVLINLPDWPAQQHALAEVARVLKTGGLLLLSEATLQGWRNLNAFREEWQLPPIPMPSFNLYLDQEQLLASARPAFELVEVVNFSSTYFVATRVLKPLLVRALQADISVGNPDMEWNRWWAALPAVGDYGTQKLFVFRKA